MHLYARVHTCSQETFFFFLFFLRPSRPYITILYYYSGVLNIKRIDERNLLKVLCISSYYLFSFLLFLCFLFYSSQTSYTPFLNAVFLPWFFNFYLLFFPLSLSHSFVKFFLPCASSQTFNISFHFLCVVFFTLTFSIFLQFIASRDRQ